MTTLAIDGGRPAREDTELPSVMNAAGRTFGVEEEQAVVRVLRSGMLSGVWGTEVRALEREFADALGVSQAVACSSGTAAIHLAVAAVDPEPGDEIILPPISDMGSVAPVLAQNAVPVFADVDPSTGCIDPASVAERITAKTRAIIAVHLFGRPADVVALRSLADRHGLILIEDCAQAYLAQVGDGAYAGSAGHVGCFSLQQTKHITTGDGGLVTTGDEALAGRMRLFADKGWPRDTGDRDYLFLGLNYRMTELVAAVAREQLRKLPGVIARRQASAARVSAAIAGCEDVRAPSTRPDHVFWYYPVTLRDDFPGGNAAFARTLTAEGVPAIPGYIPRPLYESTVLREGVTYGRSSFPIEGVAYERGSCPVAEELIDRRLVVLPWNENYSPGDEADIAAAIVKVHDALRNRAEQEFAP